MWNLQQRHLTPAPPDRLRRRSRAGTICQKWRENENSLASPAAAPEPIRWTASSCHCLAFGSCGLR